MKILFVGTLFFSSVTLLAKAPALTSEELSVPPPRIIRTCCSFGSDLSIAGIPFIKSTNITSLKNIGVHQYLGSENEGNGNIYTRKGGFVDLGHVRDCADWTAYLYNLILFDIEKNDSTILDLGTEGGAKSLTLKIPNNFIPSNASELAGKIAYDLSLWHEIATWFGASYIPLVPERYSSFSPEDLYSNLLGVNLAIKAIKSNLEYNEAMTMLISKTMDSLQAVATIEETYAAMEKVEDIWWTREKSLPSKNVLLIRYFDSDVYLIPWLIPGELYSKSPYILSKPKANLTELYELKINLNFKFPIRELNEFNIGKSITQNDFGFLIKFIENDMVDSDNKLAYRIQKSRKRKQKRSQPEGPLSLIESSLVRKS